jgi:predicted transcriptional regulator
MENTLMKIGLSRLQASAYLFLIEHGPSIPRVLINELDITRTNAYKVLESLEVMGLAYKVTRNKKIVYSPADPSSLSSLVAQKRNDIISLEHDVDNVMQGLRRRYSEQNRRLEVETKTGKVAMKDEFEKQAKLNQPIYFYKTRADIPFLGFEVMDKIRSEQSQESPRRYGITPDSPEGPLSKEIDNRTRLTRTWIDEKEYTAPVEWSVSGDRLIIQVFDGAGSVVSMNNPLIAESFKQIWQLSDNAIKSAPGYKTFPRKARRLI